MVSFCICLMALLVGGYAYGTFVDKVFGPESNRLTPSHTLNDGIDFMPMPTWKVYLIQFLNIAGTGPIFGAIMGILFGPAAYLWIVFGCIFAGAVHDYLVGMVCMRSNGVSIPEIVGNELGKNVRILMRIFSIVLLILVGAVFVVTPAGLMADLWDVSVGSIDAKTIWTIVIFVYFILATLLPIDKVIGRFYPIFGIALLIMAIGVGAGLFFQPGHIPELTEIGQSVHPKGLPIIPMLCITIACGAISGFHATQTPLMSRCLMNERNGRWVFYGAMITEGVVALIWASAAIKYAGSYTGLAALGNPAIVVNRICSTWLGKAGAILAVLGVVAAPVTSGDTAFRSARLIMCDFIHLKTQKSAKFKNIMLSLPLFILAALLMMLDFDVLWRYFAWSNQTLATIVLWSMAVWLLKRKKLYLIALVPAVFMTFIVTSYIIYAPEGFQLSLSTAYICGTIAALYFLLLFLRYKNRRNKNKQ